MRCFWHSSFWKAVPKVLKNVATRDTSQLSIRWLNALPNVCISDVTFEVSQVPIGWLKELAPENILDIVVELLVSHPPMSPLKPEPPGKPQKV